MFDREKEIERLREKCLQPKLYDDDSSTWQPENPYFLQARLGFSNVIQEKGIVKIIFEE